MQANHIDILCSQETKTATTHRESRKNIHGFSVALKTHLQQALFTQEWLLLLKMNGKTIFKTLNHSVKD